MAIEGIVKYPTRETRHDRDKAVIEIGIYPRAGFEHTIQVCGGGNVIPWTTTVIDSWERKYVTER